MIIQKLGINESYKNMHSKNGDRNHENSGYITLPQESFVDALPHDDPCGSFLQEALDRVLPLQHLGAEGAVLHQKPA